MSDKRLALEKWWSVENPLGYAEAISSIQGPGMGFINQFTSLKDIGELTETENMLPAQRLQAIVIFARTGMIDSVKLTAATFNDPRLMSWKSKVDKILHKINIHIE